MVTDRPDATESAVTVGVGVFQLESGYTFDKADGVRIHSLGEILLRVGVADILELRFGINSYQWARCLLYTSPTPRDGLLARMPSSA